MADYTIKFHFSTALIGKGTIGISGGSYGGEIDITVSGPFDKTDKENQELIDHCKLYIQQNHKIKGAILYLEISNIIEKAPDAR